MAISLLFVLGCAVSLFFVSMKEVSSTSEVTNFANYSSVATFSAQQNATVIPQDSTNFNRWAMVPGQFESTSQMNVTINEYSSDDIT